MSDFPFLIQRQQIAIAEESTEGVGESIVNGDVIAPIFEQEYAPEFTLNERSNIQASFSHLPQISGEISASVTFSTEVKGSGSVGTVPPNLSVALKACGFAEVIVGGVSVTYKPSSGTIPSATIEVRELTPDGTAKIKRIVGARGTVAFVMDKGNPVMANFEFTGRYEEPTEGSALTTPSPGPNPLPFLSAAFSFQGDSLVIAALSIDMANNVVMRNDVNQATGNFSAVIVGRSPGGTIDPEQTLIATANFFNALTTNAEGILTFALTGSAGNITTFTASKAQIIGLSEADRDGIRVENLDIQFNQVASAGDDELSIAFT